eukprot:2644672-Pleurochrysis_carterae.AAC.8
MGHGWRSMWSVKRRTRTTGGTRPVVSAATATASSKHTPIAWPDGSAYADCKARTRSTKSTRLLRYESASGNDVANEWAADDTHATAAQVRSARKDARTGKDAAD